jgi:hypothetical protein
VLRLQLGNSVLFNANGSRVLRLHFGESVFFGDDGGCVLRFQLIHAVVAGARDMHQRLRALLAARQLELQRSFRLVDLLLQQLDVALLHIHPHLARLKMLLPDQRL